MWSRTALVLVLVCGSVTPAEEVTRSGSLDFGSVPAELYETVAHYEPGGVGMLFSMVHAFLHVVQPNPFPEDLVITMAKEKFGGVQSEYQKVLYYEVGFVVCVSLGVAFSVLLPLVGLLFCLCRCCNNCGGEMHQRQRKNAECLRGLLTTLLLTTTFIITAGVLCAYAANQNLSSQLKSMRRLVKSNLRDLHTFTNQTPAQIDYVVSQYGTVKRHVLYDLENVGSILGGKIHSELGKGVQPALDATLSMTGTMRDTKDALENVSLTLETLQDGTSKLQSNLSLVRTSLANACSAPAPPAAQVCRNIRQVLPRLEIAANYSSLSDVTEQLNSVNHVLKTDLSLIVEKGLASFNDTPTMVTDQTRNIVEGVKVLLDDIGTNISSFTALFPIHASLVNFSRVITHTHSQIEDVYPQIDQMDFYRWMVCISLCCMVVLVLTFNFLGLLCGIMGFDRHSSPTTRGCVSNTGGNLLMAGVGFSFMFCWALMVVVTALFLLGGNLEKLLCEPFQTRQLFKVIDAPNLVHSTWRNFIPGYLYNDPDMDLTAYSLYSNCKDNRGIYSALHLDKLFNISAFFNTSVFSADLSKRFAGMKVDLRSIILLEAEGKQNLISFTETGISEIDFAAYLDELNRGVTRVDLLAFASELDGYADQLSQGSLHTSLKGHANTIKQIHNQQVVPLEQSMKYVKARSTLNQSIRLLERTSSDLPIRVREVLEAVDEAQFLISNNATFIVNQETQRYRQTLGRYFRQYLDWIGSALELEVATCKPLSNVLDTAEILACSFLLDSMNTFWFGLGSSTLFLLPSIILSVKLAKFYRRMDTEDVYDDMEIGNNGYYNEQLDGIGNPVMSSLPTYDTMTRFPRASAPPRHTDW